jgi:hypothetical protein
MTPAFRPAGHWSTRFSDLVRQTGDPFLDALRVCCGAGQPVAAAHPLAHVLAQIEAGLGRPLRIGPPGASARSFDEDWILALVAAQRAADLTRYGFLLRARLGPEAVAEVHFGLQQALIWVEERG